MTNTQMIDPMPVITGAAEYPQDLEAKLKASGARVDALDCLKLGPSISSCWAGSPIISTCLRMHGWLPWKRMYLLNSLQ